MSDPNQTISAPGPQFQERDVEHSLDVRLLGQAVIELNIARKNCSIYPTGHVQLARSIDRAYQALAKLLETMPEVKLGAAKDCLFIEDNSLDQKNPVFRDFALALYSRDIAAISIRAGLVREDISQLCRVLTLETEAIREAGGIVAVMESSSVEHIHLQSLDYTGLHLTEEKEIFTGGEREKPGVAAQIWRSFVSRLISNELDAGGQPDYLAMSREVDPSQVAELLNSGILDLRSAIESYEHTIARYLRETTGDQPMENLISLLRDLNPTLRSQFLSVTFDHTARNGDERLLDAFPCDVVVEILQQANEEGKGISPTLISLLEKLSRCETDQRGQTGEQAPRKQRENMPGPLTRDGMQQLFNRESYETYVDGDYKTLLRSLITSGNPRGSSQGSIRQSDWEEPQSLTREDGGQLPEKPQNMSVHSVEENELNVRLGKMIIALMDKPMDLDDYQGFSGKIITLVPDLLASGQVDVCEETLDMFRRHMVEKPELVQRIAGECLLAFNSARVAEPAVAALDACPAEFLDRAVSFVAQLGSQYIPKIIALYAQEEYPSKKDSLVQVLAGFGEEVLEKVCMSLEGEPEHVLRNLLLLIQRIGGQQPLAHVLVRVRALVSHMSRNVRQDALTTLLELKDPDAALYLRRALNAIEFSESLHAIFVAGFYRVSDVVEDLVRLISLFPFSKNTFRRNEEIIRSLGSIGDERALPRLERLARRTVTLRPRLYRRMRWLVFESLSRYPRETISTLLRMGVGSRDTRIRRTSERLSQGEEELAEGRESPPGQGSFQGSVSSSRGWITTQGPTA